MRMTLQRRLMLVITMIVILTVATTGYMSYSRSTSTLDEQTRKSMMEQSRSEINTISNTMKEQWTKLDITTSDDDVLRILKMTPEEPGYAEEVAHVNKDLVSFVKKWGDMEHAYVINKQGIVLADSDTKLIGTDKKMSTYTKDTLVKGKGQVSETLVSKTSGALVMEFTQPVKENGETIGFIADSVLVDSFARYLSQVKVNETSSSYAYMVDAQGTMLYHPQKDKVGKPVENDSIKKVVERLKNGEEVSPDTTVYEYKGAQKYASYALVPETHWILVITADQKELFAPIRDMMRNLFLIGLVIVILGSILGYYFARRISHPIRNLTTVIEKTANFDLAVNEKFNKAASMNTSKDEIGSMVRAMQTMRQGLRDMVERLVQSSSIIDGNAQNLQNAAREMRGYAHENSATTEQLSAGMEETAASTVEISASTEEVKRNVEHISAKVQHGSELSDEITHRALLLKTEALESNSSAQSLYESVKHNLEASLEQVKTIDQINFLAESILAIAQQTNLLSLNAAIEAARAGEAGRGFSVVAEEIRKLADQSSQTVSSIQGMVEVVISSVENMKESSTQLLEFIDLKVLNDYRKLLNVSEQYNGDALLVKSLMDDVSGITEELHVTMMNITTAIQAMAVTSSEGAAGAQDIATKTSDIVDQTARVEAAASENRSSILHLREVLSQFKF